MKKIKTLLSLAVLSAAAVVTSAHAQDCKPKFTFSTVKPGVLSVALTNTPPYSIEKDGVSGIDGDILQLFAKENCLKIEYEVLTYPAAISSVSTGRADVAAGGFYRTAARAKVVALSKATYLDQMAIESKAGYKTIEELKGKKIGTVEGYLWVADAEKVFPNMKTYPNSLNLAQDVMAGRLDAGFEGYAAALDALKGQSEYKVTLLAAVPSIKATTEPTQAALPLSPKNEALITAVNTTLDTIHKDGTLLKILGKYNLDPSAADVGGDRLLQ